MKRLDGTRLLLLPAVLAAAAFAAAAMAAEEAPPTDGWTLNDLFARLPPRAEMIMGVSSVEALLANVEEVVHSPFMASMLRATGAPPWEKFYQYLLEDQEVDEPITTKEGLFDFLGVDGTRPSALSVFVDTESVCAIVPFGDMETFMAQAHLNDSEPVDVKVNGEKLRAGLTRDEEGPRAWFIYDDYVFMAENVKMLRRMAKWVTNPHAVAYGTANFPDTGGPEFTALLNTGRLLADAPSGSTYFDTFAQSWPTIAIGIPLVEDFGKRAFLRIHRKIPSEEAVAEPLQLARLLPEQALSVVGFRLTPALKEFALAMVKESAPKEMVGQITGGINLVAGTLGKEVVLASLSIDPAAPRAILLAESGSPLMLSTLLAFAGATQESAGDYNEATMSEIALPSGETIHLAVKEPYMVAGFVRGDVEAMLDRLTSEPGETGPLPEGAYAEANHALMVLRETAVHTALDMAAQFPGVAEQLPFVDWGLCKDFFRGDQGLTVTENPGYIDATMHGSYGATLVTSVVMAGFMSAYEEDCVTSGQKNLAILGTQCRKYAQGSLLGEFPPVPSTPGKLMMDPKAVYPAYIDDVGLFQSPPHDVPVLLDLRSEEDIRKRIDDYHYVYVTHLVRNEAEIFLYTKGYIDAVERGTGFNADYEVEGRPVYRLREGLEAAVIPDDTGAQAELMAKAIVMVERPGLRSSKGGNVLYFDGHVEFVAWGQFPYTDGFWESIATLDWLQPGGPVPEETPYGSSGQVNKKQVSPQSLSTIKSTAWSTFSE